MQVHRGFYTAYHNTTLRSQVVAAVISIKEQVNPLNIMITGHSMGGAMAAFCALDLLVCNN
jgi:putative lipase involved disintegration of autophagic bodies